MSDESRPRRDPGSSVGLLQAEVLGWFAAHARELPWRASDRTAWGVLVSEVMLQQTPVARVLPAWIAWMERWPGPADVARSSAADVLRAWDRLGYPRRALRLLECARAITDRHDGVVPRVEDDLRALPGIGAYTAAAVVAFAYGSRSVVLDTNVRRVVARAVSGLALPAPHQTVAEVRLAEALVPAEASVAAAWAAASMELGALVCTARAPRCEVCPIAHLCRWRLAGKPPDVHADRRRTQAWAGTDRQARGRVMALLRAASEPVPRVVVAEVWPDRAQLERSLAGLVADGLVEELEAFGPGPEPAFRLPVGRSAVAELRSASDGAVTPAR